MFALPIFPGERWERCRWQIKRPERVAVTGEGRRCIVTEDIRRVSQQAARQVLSAQMSLTSVFGMGSDGSAACGG